MISGLFVIFTSFHHLGPLILKILVFHVHNCRPSISVCLPSSASSILKMGQRAVLFAVLIGAEGWLFWIHKVDSKIQLNNNKKVICFPPPSSPAN